MGLTWTPSSADVYNTVSGTFTFNDDDVKWVYVDWDDGEFLGFGWNIADRT